MDTLTKIGLMKEVAQHIRVTLDQGGHPVHLEMEDWGFAEDGEKLSYLADDLLDKEWENPSCETVACFAGHAFLHPKIRKDMRAQSWDDPSEVDDWLTAGCPVAYEPFTRLFSPGLDSITDEHGRDGLIDYLEAELDSFAGKVRDELKESKA